MPQLSSLITRMTHIGVHPELSPGDARHVTVANGIIVVGALMILILALKNYLMGHPAHVLLALIEFGVVLLLPLGLLFNHRRRYFLGATFPICLAMGMNVVGTYLVGMNAGVQITLPVFVLAPYLVYPRRHIRAALVMTVLATLVTGLSFALMPSEPAIGPAHDPKVASLGVGTAAVSLCVVLGVLTLVSRRATEAAELRAAQEHERAEALLHNMLPSTIAEQLKHSSQTIAERAADVTVLFADIVGFTPLSQSVAPEELLEILDEIFSTFDRLTDAHGLEKIKTIGDAYMVAGGVPEPRPDHAEAVAHLALEMLEVVRGLRLPDSSSLQLRVGFHCGPVVAGVIGQRKFAYDLWGDTVNTASRLESHGSPGHIHVTRSTRDRLAERFEFERRGVIAVKGKGELETWYLTKTKAPLGQPSAS